MHDNKQRSIELCQAIKGNYPDIISVKTGDEDNSHDVDNPFVMGLSGAVYAVESDTEAATVTRYDSIIEYVAGNSSGSTTVDYPDTETAVKSLGDFVS